MAIGKIGCVAAPFVDVERPRRNRTLADDTAWICRSNGKSVFFVFDGCEVVDACLEGSLSFVTPSQVEAKAS